MEEKESKLLTAVIPVKNEEANIGKCLDSLMGHEDWLDIVVVDNASTDRTAGIVRERGVPLHAQGPERSAQRNRGWMESRSRHVLFVDADMRLGEALLAEIKEMLLSDDPPDACFIREVRAGRGWWTKTRNFERSFYDGTEIDAVRIVRRDFLEKTGGFDANLIGGEDWDLSRRIEALGAKTAITANALLHDEGQFSWRRHIRKKLYYSSTLDAYREKWGNDARTKRQLGLIYRFFTVFVQNGGWKKILRHPLMTASVFLERFAVGFCFLFRKRAN